jgi:hypothetical protein
MNPLIQCKPTILPLFIAGVLACFGLLPRAQAVVPPPDGGYPNFTTAAGDNALQALTSGLGNTGIGTFSLFSVTTGNFNTAVGAGSLDLNTADSNTATGAAALLFNTTGTENTANGIAALEFNETGSDNTANGAFALFNNTTGSFNTAIGSFALLSNITGGFNTATGRRALQDNTIGGSNTANGFSALQNNTEGTGNTATGSRALEVNTTGNDNTANGVQSLEVNTIGSRNTATGSGALNHNSEGINNTATGFNALSSNTTSGGNTAIGSYALTNHETGAVNTAIGEEALQGDTAGTGNTGVGYLALNNNATGDNNTALGSLAGSEITGSGNVCIGDGVHGEAGVDDRTYIRNVNTLAQTFSPGVNDYVTVRLSDGRLGHTQVVSSERYKQDIKPLAATSQALYALKPVSFRLKKEFDPMQAVGFGLIAEEVEKVDPALVYRNGKGQVESVRYEMVNAMLLNEFLKEHRKNEEQQATITRLQNQVEALSAGLQRVSAQLELSKFATGRIRRGGPAPQIVLNDQ